MLQPRYSTGDTKMKLNSRSVTSGVGRFQVRATPGSTGTGPRMGITTGGWQGAGTVRPMKAHIGTIPTMITTGKAGSCMKATGIMKITTGTTDVTAITSIVTA